MMKKPKPLFDIDREDLYRHRTPETKDRTRQRLIEMADLGLDEVGYGEFGINGIISGVYIERVWNDSDEDFKNYLQWIKQLIKEKSCKS